MRDLQQTVRLIATLLFGLLVLGLLFLFSAQMAAHHLQGVAERAVRQVFTEGIQTRDDVGYETFCRNPDSGDEKAAPCDPIAIKADRSLRSASCRGGGFFRFLGRQWSCVARFTDGARLQVYVSIGFGRRHLELALPWRETDS